MPTRRFSTAGSHTDCPWCGFQKASARYFATECPHLDTAQADLEAEYDIPATWWEAQPHITTKSAWITRSADPDSARRKQLAIAVARLLISVAEELAPFAEAPTEDRHRR